jgi:hypothetical protein
MDPRPFNELACLISRLLSRREVVGDSLAAALLAAIGLDEGSFAQIKTESRRSRPSQRRDDAPNHK